MWIVPGAPLERGEGWRIWCCRPGNDDFEPGPVSVTRRGRAEETDQSWKLLEPLEELERRIGVLTLRLARPAPGERYEVAIPEAGTFSWRSLPAAVGERLAFLFGSCFWLPGDREGAYAAAVRDLTKTIDPAFKLMMGDQVYQDYPLQPVPANIPRQFARRYEQYWGDAKYREVLCSAPNFFTCDDHEFWNNFPERQPWLPHTWDAFRRESAEAAQASYHRFQRSANPDESAFYRFSVDPVSFFVTDARSERHDIKEP